MCSRGAKAPPLKCTPVYLSENVIKMENSLVFIFDEIWPTTLYYSTGTFTRFWSNFKNS